MVIAIPPTLTHSIFILYEKFHPKGKAATYLNEIEIWLGKHVCAKVYRVDALELDGERLRKYFYYREIQKKMVA